MHFSERRQVEFLEDFFRKFQGKSMEQFLEKSLEELSNISLEKFLNISLENLNITLKELLKFSLG